MDHLTEQLAASLIASQFLEFLKNSKWFGLIKPESSSDFKKLIGFLLAITTAAGVHFSTTGSFVDGTGLTLTITGVSLSAVKDIIIAWSSQQAWYDGLVKDKTNG